MKKKVLSLTLALAVIMSLAVTSYADGSPYTYEDEYVQITNTISDGEGSVFQHEVTCTAPAEVVTITGLVEFHGSTSEDFADGYGLTVQNWSEYENPPFLTPFISPGAKYVLSEPGVYYVATVTYTEQYSPADLSYYKITVVEAGPADPGPTQPQQPDAPAYQVSNWAKDRVALAVETGLAADSLGGDYRVNITRAQFAATAVKLYEAMSGEKAEATGESSFTDTTDPVILLAADLGFVSGVGGGKFSPEALVTREQAAVMLSSVFTRLGGEIPAVEATTFADNGDVAGWARNAVAFMNSKEIVTGVGNNNFSPKGNASIEQALLIALKMFETLK